MKYELKPAWLIAPLVVGMLAWYLTRDFAVGVAAFAIALLPVVVRIYLPYAKDNPKGLWFKRKLYGWGWTPVTWQGWAVTAGYVALVFAFAFTLDETASAQDVAFTFVLPIFILTAAFIRIAYKKGEKPQWQWGRAKDEKES